MSLETLSQLGQIIGVVAVLASLAAVYWQLRQTNEIARATLTQSTWLAMGQMQLSLADDPEKAELMRRALSGAALSEAERLRMEYVIPVALGLHEAAFNLRKRGMIEQVAYNSSEFALRGYVGSPIIQAWWARNRVAGKDPGFVALIDGLIAEINALKAGAAPSKPA